jgi:hypothetical protein
MDNYKKYYEEIIERSLDFSQCLEYLELIREDVEEEHLKILLITSTILYFNNSGGGESIDLAAEIVKQLQIAELDKPLSTTFIKSIFNFDNVYRPIYDLLDLATTGKYQGKKMSDEYRNGIIDSIVALRRYQRHHGLGDHEWEITYNTTTLKEYDD